MRVAPPCSYPFTGDKTMSKTRLFSAFMMGEPVTCGSYTGVINSIALESGAHSGKAPTQWVVTFCNGAKAYVVTTE